MALRDPDFGNKWITKLNVIQNRNASGEPSYLKRGVQLVEEGFEIAIQLVKRSDLNTLIADLLAAAGSQVTYTDFEGTVWTGYWLPTFTTSRGRIAGSPCGEEFRVQLRFQGTHA